jgi:hypothetical protein
VRYTKRERELQAKKKNEVYQQVKKKRKQYDDALISSFVCTGGTRAHVCVCILPRERLDVRCVFRAEKQNEATVQKIPFSV